MKNRHKHEWQEKGDRYRGKSFKVCAICGTRAMPRAVIWIVAGAAVVIAAIAISVAIGDANEPYRPPNDRRAAPLATDNEARAAYLRANAEAESCWAEWEALGDIPYTSDLEPLMNRCLELAEPRLEAMADYCDAVLAVLLDERHTDRRKADTLLRRHDDLPRCWGNRTTPRIEATSERIEVAIRDLGGLRRLRQLL